MSAPRAAATAVLMVALVSPALAQGGNDFATRCKQWLDKKGYSVDYIEHKTGKRQPGLAPRWKGNLALAEVQAGDVVISSIPGGFGGGGTSTGGTLNNIRINNNLAYNIGFIGGSRQGYAIRVMTQQTIIAVIIYRC